MPKLAELEEIGAQYGRPDIERIGLFIEAPYMNGKKYVSPFPKAPKAGGRNIMGEGRKTKCGNMDGYFDDEFRRICEGEGINWKKDKRKQKGPKFIGARPFYPPDGDKKNATPGDYYGSFSGNIAALGTGYKYKAVRKVIPKILPNFKIGARKMGDCGYADICLNPYPEHKPDPYTPKKKKEKKSPMMGRAMVPCHFPQPCFDPNPYVHPDGKIASTYVRPKYKPPHNRGTWVPTGPAKWEGGCKGGTFDPWPEWKPCKYFSLYDVEKPRKRRPGANFYPQSMACKSLWNYSTISKTTDLRVNAKNYPTYESNYIKYLVD